MTDQPERWEMPSREELMEGLLRAAEDVIDGYSATTNRVVPSHKINALRVAVALARAEQREEQP